MSKGIIVADQYRLYVDSDGIRRGYYVYLHRERDTGEVFYVGKGHGRRAWQKTNRNDLWKKRIEILGDGWDVEIVADDLGELAAFELEFSLVEKYGGCAAEGGTLTNWISGGGGNSESDVNILFGPAEHISFNSDSMVWCHAYETARQFRELSRPGQEQMAQSIMDSFWQVEEPLHDLIDEAEEKGDESLSDSAEELQTTFGGFTGLASDFLDHRIVWQAVCIRLEEICDDLEEDEIESFHQVVRPYAHAVAKTARHYLAEIDSGNRAAAELIADQAKANYLDKNAGQADTK